MKFYIILISVLLLSACSSDNSEQPTNEEKQSSKSTVQQDQLNITILLDLSDRIDTKKYPEKPEHYERDIAIVRYFSEVFIKDMEKRGTFMAKGKLKVIFSPKPQDPNVNILAEKLSVDLSGMDNKAKKDVHDNLTDIFTESITKIYTGTLSQNKWLGSDIWRFFKNDVRDYCVETDPQYRNILILLSDGYIYHRDSRNQDGNRFAYLLPENISTFNLRKNTAWEQEIEKKNFGLITTRHDLDNLEVLVLEVSPSFNYKNDEDIIKSVLGKWFKEMHVKKFALYNSDLPQYTKQHIDDFIK